MSEQNRPGVLDDLVARIARLDAADGLGERVRQRLDARHATPQRTGRPSWLWPLGAAALAGALVVLVWSPWRQEHVDPRPEAIQQAELGADGGATAARAPRDEAAPSGGTAHAPAPRRALNTSPPSPRAASTVRTARAEAADSLERQRAEAWTTLHPEPIHVAPIEVAALDIPPVSVDAIDLTPIEIEPLPAPEPIEHPHRPQ